MITFLMCLLVSIAQWLIYYKFQRWRRDRYIEAEPQQGKAVDRVLYHELTDLELPWQAGESWSKYGRGYTVALERQGLGNILDERDVDDFRAVYCLGYTVREQADQRELQAIQKRLERSQSHVDKLNETIAELKEKLSEGNQTSTRPIVDSTAQTDPLTESMNEWGSSQQTLDELMRAKGWQRINPVSVPVAAPVAPVPVAPVSVIVQDPEPDQQTQTDYSSLKGDERKATMTQLKDDGMSYSEIAKLFAVSVGCVKFTVSNYRKTQNQTQNNVVPISFNDCADGLESACNGV